MVATLPVGHARVQNESTPLLAVYVLVSKRISSIHTTQHKSRGADKKLLSSPTWRDASSPFSNLSSSSSSSSTTTTKPAATSVSDRNRRPQHINHHHQQHSQSPLYDRNGIIINSLSPTPRDLFPVPPAYEALAQRVTQAVNANDLPGAMACLRELNALHQPSPSSSPTRSSIRFLISSTAFAVLHLCLAERKRTEGEQGIEEALQVLTLANLATSYDKGCTRTAFTTLPITETSSWATTMTFFRHVLTYLPPAAWPAPHQWHRALRQLADAGQPTQCQWLLDRMQRPQPLAPPHEEGREGERPSFLPPPPMPIGSAGQLHSPRWHLLKSYLYSHQPLQAVRLLQSEKNPRLDRNTANMVLKALARERLGEDALNFLTWAEEEAGVETNTESYNHALVGLAKANRSFHPYTSSASSQRLPRPSSPPPLHEEPPAAATTTTTIASAAVDTTAAARGLLPRMQARGLMPDKVTYCALLDAYAEADDVEGTLSVFFEEMCQMGREGWDGADGCGVWDVDEGVFEGGGVEEGAYVCGRDA